MGSGRPDRQGDEPHLTMLRSTPALINGKVESGARTGVLRPCLGPPDTSPLHPATSRLPRSLGSPSCVVARQFTFDKPPLRPAYRPISHRPRGASPRRSTPREGGVRRGTIGSIKLEHELLTANQPISRMLKKRRSCPVIGVRRAVRAQCWLCIGFDLMLWSSRSGCLGAFRPLRPFSPREPTAWPS